MKSGESKTLVFKISPQQLVQYEDGKWIIEAGKYEFKIGASCTDIRQKGVVDLQGKDLILDKGREVFFTENEIK